MKDLVDIVNSASSEQEWTFEVESESMYPFLKEGEKVKIRKSDNYGFGDVLVFKYGEELVVHRVIWCYDGTFYTKGDAVRKSIEHPKKEKILGKVKTVINGDKKYSEGKIVSKLKALKSLVKYGLYRIFESSSDK